MPAATEPAEPAGDLLDGRYRLLERLDRGGMATVWRAHDQRLSRPVAVKMLHSRPGADRRARARMRVEAQALAGFSHPHIANVYDYGTTGDGAYLVMELVDGEPLARVLAARTSLPWRAAVAVGAQVAGALAAAHARGLVHRDVSAANVMLTPAGAKLIDFGLCAVEGGQEIEPDGSVCGTPAYIAPERLAGRRVDTPADVYSLGILLYRALAGRIPWPASTPETVVEAQRRWDPQPLPEIDGLPAEVAELCLRCWPASPRTGRPPRRWPACCGGSRRPPTISATWRRRGRGTPDARRALGISSGALRPRLSVRHRRLLGATGWTTGAALALLLIWWATAWIPAGEHGPPQAIAAPVIPAAAPAEPAPPPAGVPCAVTYLVIADNGSAFTATVSVANTGTAALPTGRLSFSLPGGQRVDTARSPGWRQDGATVTSAPQTSVRHLAGTVRLTVAGRYPTANPLPTTFSLDGQPCAATAIGPARTPVVGAVPRPAAEDSGGRAPKPAKQKLRTGPPGNGGGGVPGGGATDGNGENDDSQ